MEILVVDDNKDGCRLLKSWLKAKDYAVECACNGAEALEKLHSRAFNLIISDIMMPVMDGFQFCRQCKQDAAIKFIPFIFYTATYTDDKDESLALKIGADRFIRKPVEPDQLLSQIQEVLSLSALGQVPEVPPEKADEQEVLKLYSERLVNKLEKKIAELSEINSIVKQSEAALKESELRYLALIESLPIALSIVQEERIILTNRYTEKITGYPEDKLKTMDVFALIHPEDRGKVRNFMVERLKSQPVPDSYLLRIIHKDGKTRWFDRRPVMITWKGKPAILVLDKDITEQKRAEEKVAHLNHVLSAIRNVNQLIVRENNARALILETCRTLTRTRGFNHAVLILTDNSDTLIDFAEDGLGINAEALREFMLGGKLPPCCEEAKKKPFGACANNGAACPGCPVASLYPRNTGLCLRIYQEEMLYGYLIVSSDIQGIFDSDECLLLEEMAGDIAFGLNRIKQKEQLMEEATWRRILMEQSSDGIVVMDVNGNVTEANRRFAAMHGYTPGEVTHLHISDWSALLSPGGTPPDLLTIDEKGDHFEVRHKRKDGTVFDVEISSNAAFFQGKKLIFCVVRDISERKLAEAELKSREQFLDTVIEQTPNPLWISDRNGTVIRMNQALRDLLKATDQEIVGKYNVLQDVQVSEQGCLDKVRSVFEEGKTVSFSLHYETRQEPQVHLASNAILFLDIVMSALKNNQGKVVNVICQHKDITEQRAAERKLRQSEHKFRELFNNIGSCVAVYEAIDSGKDFMFVDFNKAAENAESVEKAKVIGRAVTEVFPGVIEFGLLDVFRRVWLTGIAEHHPVTLYSDQRITGWRENYVYKLPGGEIVSVYEDVTESRNLERQRELSLKVLEVLDQPGEKREILNHLLDLIRADGQYEAVGIRLREGEDYPYYETKGFSSQHVQMENKLCAFDEKGMLLRDYRGNPVLECMCGNIICGRFDPSKPFFTGGGSFWTNSTTELLASTTEVDRQARTRNRCHGEGYESVALIPLKARDKILGLLQINDTRINCFTLELIKYYEGLAQSIGIALSQKQMEESLQASEIKYRDLYENAPVAYFSIGTDGKINSSNKAAQLFLGYSEKELEEKLRIEIYAPESAARAMTLFEQGNRGIPIQNEEMIYLRKDGGKVHGLVSATPIMDDEGRVVSVRSVVKDITEIKKSEAKTIEIEALKRINQAKSELLANVSHELRTPLASIKGFIETLIEPDVNWTQEQQLEFLQMADREADRLTFLIRDLLDMSRIDSGKMVLDKKLCHINEIMASISGVLSIITEKHRLKLTQEPRLPAIEVDRTRIGQVLTNLVENAAKFSAEGSQIVIEIKGTENGIVFSVMDKGIGISQESQNSLFDRFFQAQQVVSGKTRGTGLGLAICKGIVEAHGGKIWVESEPDEGSKFSFTIPRSSNLGTPA
ncbi:MAG: PAS domain S-box protein [Dehalococcoidales bacterium]|nr:PAS domain S-box protein [Dehalococcoidales bacterium]